MFDAGTREKGQPTGLKNINNSNYCIISLLLQFFTLELFPQCLFLLKNYGILVPYKYKLGRNND